MLVGYIFKFSSQIIESTNWSLLYRVSLLSLLKICLIRRNTQKSPLCKTENGGFAPHYNIGDLGIVPHNKHIMSNFEKMQIFQPIRELGALKKVTRKSVSTQTLDETKVIIWYLLCWPWIHCIQIYLYCYSFDLNNINNIKLVTVYIWLFRLRFSAKLIMAMRTHLRSHQRPIRSMRTNQVNRLKQQFCSQSQLKIVWRTKCFKKSKKKKDTRTQFFRL